MPVVVAAAVELCTQPERCTRNPWDTVDCMDNCIWALRPSFAPAVDTAPNWCA